MSKAGATSANMKPCNCANAELHCSQERREKYDYVRHDLTSQNVHWHRYDERPLTQCFDDACKLYTESTGQQPQLGKVFRFDKKTNRKREIEGFAPIREMVVVIKPETTEKDIDNLCKEMQKRFGMTPLAFSIHRDEGHWAHEVNAKTGEVSKVWKPNLHAHLFFDVMERRLKDHKGKEISEKKRGRTIKFTEVQTRMMQDITANVLGMERGEVGSKRTHEDQIEFKRAVQAEELSNAIIQTNEKKAEIEGLNGQIGALRSEVEEEKDAIKAARKERERLNKEIEGLEEQLAASNAEWHDSIQSISAINEELRKKKIQSSALDKELEGKTALGERIKGAGDWLTGKSRREAKEAKEAASEEIAKVKAEYAEKEAKLIDTANAKVKEANDALKAAMQHQRNNQAKLDNYDNMKTRAKSAESKLQDMEEKKAWRERMIEKFVEFGANLRDQWNTLFNHEVVKTDRIMVKGESVPLDNPIGLMLDKDNRFMIHDQHWVTEQGFWNGIKKGITNAFDRGNQWLDWVRQNMGMGNGLRR